MSDPDLDIDDKTTDSLDSALVNMNIAEPVLKERTIKRGRGRPPKKLVEPPAPEPDPTPAPETESEPAAPGEKGRLIRIIQQLKKKLNAVGTGLEPTLANTVEELQEEVDILNNDLNSKRGDQAIKTLIMYAMPVIEMIVSNAVPRDKLDISGKFTLTEEVKNNWAVLEDAATHIAILHESIFAVGPYGELAKGIAGCALSADAKNKAERKRFAKAARETTSNATEDEKIIP